MVDRQLLDLLVCPETRQDLTLADGEVLARLNDAIAAGSVRTRGGGEVRERVEAGLVRSDGRYLYPVREDIPIMLVDEAIPLDPSTPGQSPDSR